MNTTTREPITWDAQDWRRRFHLAAQRRDHALLHELRTLVYKNTLSAVYAGGYRAESGECIDLENAEDTIEATRFYERELPQDNSKAHRYHTVVDVVKRDCLLVAKELTAEESGVCVLNLANRQNPGGGVLKGCGAQEEYLFRCSDYFRSLYQFAAYAHMYGLFAARHQYPMDRDFGGIFSPHVTIFRGSEEDGYPLLKQPWSVNMIAVPALNRPQLEYVAGEERIAAHLVGAMKNKIRTIFRIARENQQTTLVLGAFGCGAFRNPPKHTAQLFKEIMQENEFCGVFKHICFAIKEDHNSRGSGNYAPFAEVFADFNSTT